MRIPLLSRVATGASVAVVVACASAPASRESSWPQQVAIEFSRVPDTIPTRWRGLIGEYGADSAKRWYTLEQQGRLWILDHLGNYIPLAEQSDSVFEAPLSTAAIRGEVRYTRDGAGRATSVRVGDVVQPRRNIEPAEGVSQLRITPVRPIEELRAAALQARPPVEAGEMRASDLVDITSLDSTIRLDIRYATENNFLGARMYEQPRALLQRRAAEALVRANRTLRPLRYTLMIFDAYRPWYVTKIFWDATPDSVRWLVANPAQGSKHNRGAAVDVTLFDLETNKPVDMPSTYDETTTRARADYPGGTALQRYHRGLLRRVLEHEDFTVNPLEWWHFDFRDWRTYPIGNVAFGQIPASAPPAR